MVGQELVDIRNRLAEQAQAAVADLPAQSNGRLISLKSGVIALGEEEMPGNQICVVVIDSSLENTFYAGRYTAGDRSPPICYAMARGKEQADMAPHPSMGQHLDYFKPQHTQCNGCPQNEWGSADTGRGKACQNRFRLTLLPAGIYVPKRGSRDFDLEYFADPQHFAETEQFTLKLPPTSGKEWAKYVTQLSAGHRLPPHGVVTRLYCEPDPKHQFHVKFEMLEALGDDLVVPVMQRHLEASQTPFQGYLPPQKEQTQGDTLRGLRRK